jgi:DNA/RNA endonuclease YhcR with UshA esterase domain
MSARHFSRLALLFTAIVATTGSIAFSQMGSGMGMGRGRANRMYNPATEVTLKGVVEEVKTISGPRGWGGTHLTLKTESGTFDVYLGPSTYLKEKGFKFAKGEQLEVTGSKVKYQNLEAIIAREVKMGGKTLTLRNAQGVPEWAGRRRMMMNSQ